MNNGQFNLTDTGGRYSPQTIDFVKSLYIPTIQNSRNIIYISGVGMTPLDLCKGAILAGHNIMLAGPPSTGKTQLMWAMLHNIIGEDHSLAIREELHRGDIKGIFRYFDVNAVQKTGRTDEGVRARNITNIGFGIEEITRSGPNQNSLFAVVDGEVYDDSSGIFYKLGRELSENDANKYHIAIATGNLPNGDEDHTSYLGEALATRFHLFMNLAEMFPTLTDDYHIWKQQRSPRVHFYKSVPAQEQAKRLEQLLLAHKEITTPREEDFIEYAVLAYLHTGLDHCREKTGGEHALIKNSKRATEHTWPARCGTCPNYETLKFACGACMPTEVRQQNAIIQMRNALEAIALAKGASVDQEDRVANLISTAEVMIPYTVRWNPALLGSDCEQNKLTAARGVLAQLRANWEHIGDDFTVEAAILTDTGKLYDPTGREKLCLPVATKPDELLPEIPDDNSPLSLMSYLRNVLDMKNTEAKNRLMSPAAT